MIENIKVMLGSSASNFTEAQIEYALRRATKEIEAYCKRALDEELEMAAEEIAVIKLNRMNTEGIGSQSYSGISESYIDGYPDNIKKLLNSKRKLKVI